MFKRSDTRNIQDCGRFNKKSMASSHKTDYHKRVAPRKVLSSKSFHQSSDGKSCSTGVLDSERPSIAKPKKTAKSELSVKKSNKNLDLCKKCGDALSKSTQRCDSKGTLSNRTLEPTRPKTIAVNERAKSVSQYYKNENFRRSSDSVHEADVTGTRKISLDTIKELPEKYSSEVKSKNSIFDFDTNSEEEFLDTEDFETIKKLKEFRNNNYFECHSAKSRIDNKVSAISLKDHKCTYRFYLNDRLFPVPVSTDHRGHIRCVECHLPLNLRTNKDEAQANGFIQAKIRIGEKDPQHTVMYLPVKDQLIIKERKKEERKEENVVYFGVIKIDQTGNSMFNQNLPTNSLALKYQKGYKEFQQHEPYRLESMDKDNVLII